MTSSAMQVRISEASGPKRDLAVSPEMSVTYSAIYLEMYSEAGVIVPGGLNGVPTSDTTLRYRSMKQPLVQRPISRYQGLRNARSAKEAAPNMGTSPTVCPTCGGTGQVRFQQGFFSVSRTCNQCRGEGRIIKDKCPECAGEGRVRVSKTLSIKVPAGVETGSRLRLQGEGEAGSRGGPSGDLYVVITVKEHPIFTRDGEDVLCDVPIFFTQAALGAEIDVPTIEGKVKMKVPQGTQSGAHFRLKGKGIARLGGYGRGDQIVKVIVETPTKLTQRQKELLDEFAKISGHDVNPMSKGFFEKVRDLLG